GQYRLRGKDVGYRLLERCCDAGRRDWITGPLGGLDVPSDGGLEPGEGEVVPVALHVTLAGQGPREPDRRRVAVATGTLDLRGAGIRQADQPGDLVEGLPCRVVQGLPEQFGRRRDVLDQQNLSVSTGNEQGDDRIGDLAVFEPFGRDMPDQVIHPV